jgi:23S rRNA (adenine-N6)-dimethyltransferase
VEYLLSRTSINSSDTVVEIGPGHGIITKALAKVCSHVIAIEKDINLAQKLKSNRKVTIKNEDFLLSELPSREYKIFANIPYTITSDIMRKILHADTAPSDAYLIMQREAALKYLGQPFTPETLTSLIYKAQFEFSLVHTFKPDDFKPVPKVTSVLMRIKKKDVVDNLYMFKEFVTYGFVRYLPNLEKAFADIFTPAEFSQLSEVCIFSKNVRLTDLTFDQWVKMYEFFRTYLNPNIQRKVTGSMHKLEKIQKGLTKIHRTR